MYMYIIYISLDADRILSEDGSKFGRIVVLRFAESGGSPMTTSLFHILAVV